MIVEYWITRMDRRNTLHVLSILIVMEYIICIPRMGLDALMRTVALLQCRHDSLWELEAGEMVSSPNGRRPLASHCRSQAEYLGHKSTQNPEWTNVVAVMARVAPLRWGVSVRSKIVSDWCVPAGFSRDAAIRSATADIACKTLDVRHSKERRRQFHAQ